MKKKRFRFPPARKFDTSLKDASLFQHVSYFIATTFWVGHLPASGTWGALVAFLLHNFFFPELFLLENWFWGCLTVVITFLIGLWVSNVVEAMTKIKDDSRVTVDEVVGYFIAVLFVPVGWQYTIPAFILCRFFDILKPFPSMHLQNIKGGMGIMIDDVIASVYALGLIHIIIFWFY